ncbi:DUF2268 domain-containing putative Zn-dependent protease [Robertmurraya massiliosenegalensis]
MYKPNRRTSRYFQDIQKNKVWEEVARLFRKYQKRWNGPDVDIFIFPIHSNFADKGGVSFKKSIFLFLSPLEDKKEIEALFVHEYHHVCRINKQKKEMKEYTLLDSIILEGLAEHAVEYYCGEKYRANWCQYYSEKELEQYWEDLRNEIIDTKREEELHNNILFGSRGYPRLLGYAIGYHLTKVILKGGNFSTKVNFYSNSENFIK